MVTEITQIRNYLIRKILARQDGHFRWAFDERVAQERPEMTYYWPKYKSTLWTLLLLADLRAPVIPQIERSLDLVADAIYDQSNKIFSLGGGHFPFPCLNGNLLYLHFYFKRPYTNRMDGVVNFFDSYQRFDDGDFRTPRTFPYLSNKACYGKHTCYWGIINLMKGISFIPISQRTKNARHLLENCIDFILQHEVCFRSHHKDEFIHPQMTALSFPNLRDHFLAILWLLAREGIRDKRITRALELLRSRQQVDGTWALEHPVPNLIVSVGKKGYANPFITEMGSEVLDYYG